MGKVILITGASRGLGRAIYQYLLNEPSYKVYGSSRNPKEGALLQLDVRSEVSVKHCVETLIQREGRIDVLINNVGSNLIGSIEGATMQEVQGEMDTNYYGALRMIQRVLPYMRSQKKGQIINISSLGGQVPLPYNSTYAASKAALEAMSESLAYEIEGSQIHVTLVQPLGLTIETEVPNLTYIKNETAIHRVSEKLFRHMKAEVTPSVSKDRVALRVGKIIRSSKPKLTYTVGKEARPILILHGLLPNRWFRGIIRRIMLK